MNDKQKAELRRLAEAASQTGMEWPGEGEFDMQLPSEARFCAGAKPNLILSLLDENKRIASRLCACRDCGGQGEVYSGHDEYQGHFQPPEPVMDVCGTCGGDGVLGTLEDFESLAEERDQLRAEVEALRKGAARYDWLRDRVGVEFMVGDFRPWFPSDGASLAQSEKETTDYSIDAAMAEESSTND